MKKTTARADDSSREEDRRPDFEAALTRLEQIVERLDDGNLPLAESLALFKEGTQLAKVCRELLSDAELQVQTALAEVRGDADDRGVGGDEFDDRDVEDDR